MPRKSLTTLMAQDPATLTTGEELRLMIAAGRALHRPYHILFKQELPLCGARCRDGHPCQARATRDAETGCLVRNGRCRLHGGLSTGARTPEGLQRIGEASRRHWARWRQARSQPQLGATTDDLPQPPDEAPQDSPMVPAPKAQDVWAQWRALQQAQAQYAAVTAEITRIERISPHAFSTPSRAETLAPLRDRQRMLAEQLRAWGAVPDAG